MPFFRYIAVFWALSGCLQLAAQNCGIRDTLLLQAQGMNEYQLTISDLVNNDLAAADQGLCGVELSFSHQYVYDVEIILVSPSGQEITLIGPINNQFRPPTIFTRWFIDFSRCASPTAPDLGAPAQWNNNAPFNWLAGGIYRGTYHPQLGCLEDFDSGPANGNWRIRIRSDRPGAQGGIIFFRLIFCDDRGIDCCFADAGRLNVVPLERCEGHPDTDLNPTPLYNMPRPPEAEYAYTYLIGRDGIYLGLDSLADLRNQPPGNYSICGFSYRRGELGNLPAPNGNLTVAEIRSNLASFTPYLCADLTDDCYELRILPRVDTTFLAPIICVGDTYRVGNQNFGSSGLFHVNLLGRGLCDSVVQLQLAVVDTLRSSLIDTICFGESYTVGSSIYSQSGFFTTFLTASAGCDSAVSLQLTVRDRIRTDTALALCAGASFRIGNEDFSSSGIYSRVLSSSVGCDSFVTLDLAILNPRIRFADTPVINCYTPQVTLDASPSLSQFATDYRWFNANGTLLGVGSQLTTDTAGTYILVLTESYRGQSCTVRDTLSIESFQSLPAVGAGNTDTLNCAVGNIVLGSSQTAMGSQFSYQWTGPSGAVFLGTTTARFANIASPGLYQLRVTDETTGCRDSASVRIHLDTLRPLATISGVEVLNCAVTTLSLGADSLQIRASELVYSWSGDCLPNSLQQPAIEINCPGRVQLLVRNQTNACTALGEVSILQDIVQPQISVRPIPELNCYQPSQVLDARASIPANRLRYTWFNTLGGSLSNNDTLVVSSPQTYQLLIEDTINFCVDSLAIPVLSDQAPPAVDAGGDTLRLSCNEPSLTLGGDFTSQGSEFRYAWTQFGTSDTLGTNRFLTIDPPGGLYILGVFNQRNGCRNQDSVRVLLDQTPPFIRFSPIEEFGCFAEEVVVDANPTAIFYNYSAVWSGDCLPVNQDSLAVAVFCPGDYTLTLTNLDNGCVADSTVTVTLADNAVVAVLPDSTFIDCNTGLATIDRSRSTPTSRTTWLRDGERIQLAGNQPMVTVPGTYTMIISNFDGSCSDTASIEVVADCPLLAIIIPPDSLTCNRTQVVLNAGPSLPTDPTGTTIEWISDVNPACLLPGANDRQIITACPGNFSFVVRNTALGISDTASVTVRQNLVPPRVEAGPNDTINCYQPTVQLDASASEQDSRFSYVWFNSNNDTVATTQLTTTNRQGIYFLRVTNTETGCNATDATTVFRDVAIPNLRMSNQFIPCREDSFALSVLATPITRPYSYNWSGPSVLANRDSATVILGTAGVYTATVTNLTNGCPNALSILVEQLPCPPCMILRDTALTCVADTFALAIEFCEPCQGCNFSWFRNGDSIPGQNTAVLPITQPGNYRVTAINQFGLSASVFSDVVDWRVNPVAAAGPNRFLSCDSSSVLLGSLVTDTLFDYTYQWFDQNAIPVAGATTSFLRVADAGAYVLESYNVLSQCRALDTVQVAYDTLAPLANAGVDRILDCDNRFVVLDANNSSVGSNFRFQWSGFSNTACIEGTRTLSPIVICGGDYILTVRNLRNGCTSSDTVQVVAADELPRIIPLPDTNLNCRVESIDLIGYVDNPLYESSWCTNGQFGDVLAGSCQSGPSVVVDSVGSYRFTVTNPITGCFNEFSLAVGTDYRPPTAFAGSSDTLYCTLDSLALQGSASTQTGAAADFNWRSISSFPVSQANSATAYAFLPDTYILRVTDQQNGCSATDTVILFRDIAAPIALVNADTSLNCTRRQIRLIGNGQTMSGQIRYRWTTTNGLILLDSLRPNPLVGAAGNYQFSVTDPANNCSTAAMVQVTEDTIRPVLLLDTSDSLLINCYSPSLTLDLGSSFTNTGNPLVYRWLNQSLGTDLSGISSPVATVDRRGIYRLIATDQINSCKDTLAMEVQSDFTAPQVLLNMPDILNCNQIQTTLIATPTLPDAPYTYQWILPNGADTIRAATYEASQGGAYQLQLQDTLNGCILNRLLVVEEDRVPPLIVLNQPAPLNCDRASVLLSAAGSSEGGFFLPAWFNANSHFERTNNPYSIRAVEAGIFHFQLRNLRNGCISTDSVEVSRLAQAITDLQLEVIPPVCAKDLSGGVMVLGIEGGTPPYRFRLDGGILSNRMTYEDLPIGNHYLMVVDSSGCDRSTYFEVVPTPPILVDLGQNIRISLGDSVTLRFTTNLSSWDTLIWQSQGSLPQPIDSPFVIRPERTHLYQLTIRDENGCEGSGSVLVEVDNSVGLYVPNAFSPNGDNINDRFFPYANNSVSEILNFMVFDRWGNLVHEASNFPPNDPTFGWDGQLNGQALNTNTFVWQLSLRLADGKILVKNGEVLLLR